MSTDDFPPRRSGSSAVALVAAGCGLAVSGYLTVEHYDHSRTLACPESATINCQKVTTSSWSVIAGVPVAVLGLAYFAAMCVVLVLSRQHPRLATVAILAAGAGVLMVLYLIFIELFEVDAICLWCTAAHVFAIVLFAAALWRGVPTSAPPEPFHEDSHAV